MDTHDEIMLNRYFCIIADATYKARQFPGILIEASLNVPWTYSLSHRHASDLDKIVSIDRLVVEVNNLVLELQCRFGKHAEKLYEQRVPIELLA